MQFEELQSLIERNFPDTIIGENQDSTPKALRVEATKLLEICHFLHAHEKTYFDSLSCLTGLDNGAEAGSMEVIYNLYSIPYDLHLSIWVELDREKPEVESISSIWGGANWHEREAFDLLGIEFKNHPDLRRILLPDDWEGYPLRKDYEEQETYHEIKVKY